MRRLKFERYVGREYILALMGVCFNFSRTQAYTGSKGGYLFFYEAHALECFFSGLLEWLWMKTKYMRFWFFFLLDIQCRDNVTLKERVGPN